MQQSGFLWLLANLLIIGGQIHICVPICGMENLENTALIFLDVFKSMWCNVSHFRVTQNAIYVATM